MPITNEIPKAFLCCILLFYILGPAAFTQSGPAEECAGSQIESDQSSFLALTDSPELILSNPDSFWRSDPAYWLVSLWNKDVGLAVPNEGWLQIVKGLADRPEEIRHEMPEYALIEEYASEKDEFLQFMIPYLCSFFPPPGPDLSTKIYFTCAIIPNAFQKNFNIVINLMPLPPISDVSEIFNTIIHEAFHVGYYRIEFLRSEIPLDNPEQHDLIYSLQNEGLATYIAFLAQTTYPSRNRDYELIQDAKQVKKSLQLLNGLMAQAGKDAPDIFRKNLHEIGVNQRVLYDAGAHMARTIDSSLGREALAATIASGPRTFITTYNRLAEDEMKVQEYPDPQPLSAFQLLRMATLERNYHAVSEHLATLRQEINQISNPPGHILNDCAALMLYHGDYKPAIEVLNLYREFFPSQGNPCAKLGDAWLALGDSSRAASYYQKTLELSPGEAGALKLLQELAKCGYSAHSDQVAPSH